MSTKISVKVKSNPYEMEDAKKILSQIVERFNEIIDQENPSNANDFLDEIIEGIEKMKAKNTVSTSPNECARMFCEILALDADVFSAQEGHLSKAELKDDKKIHYYVNNNSFVSGQPQWCKGATVPLDDEKYELYKQMQKVIDYATSHNIIDKTF